MHCLAWLLPRAYMHALVQCLCGCSMQLPCSSSFSSIQSLLSDTQRLMNSTELFPSFGRTIRGRDSGPSLLTTQTSPALIMPHAPLFTRPGAVFSNKEGGARPLIISCQWSDLHVDYSRVHDLPARRVHPILGVFTTIPAPSTNIHTRSVRKSPVTIESCGTIMMSLTSGADAAITSFASSPVFPTSSGHSFRHSIFLVYRRGLRSTAYYACDRLRSEL